MNAFSPLVRKIEAARQGAAPPTSAQRVALAERLEAALRHALPDLDHVVVELPDGPPFELLITGRVVGVGATERGVAALEAWGAVAGGGEEWHAAWTDGGLLTLDVVLRTEGDGTAVCAAGRVVLHPG